MRILFLSFLILPLLSIGAPASAEAFSDAQKDALGGLVKDYIMENPALVVEALNKHQLNEERRQEEAAQAALKENEEMLSDSSLPSIGNADADIVIVEFFDYNCGYCKRALPDIQKVVDNHENVRVVFKELPILGPTSQTASEWALGAHKQGKYFEYHRALMEHKGAKTEDNLAKIAEDLGLDVDQLKKDVKSDDVAKMIEKSRTLANSVGVRGTPAFIVNDQFIRGYVGYDGLKAAIEKIEQGG